MLTAKYILLRRPTAPARDASFLKLVGALCYAYDHFNLFFKCSNSNVETIGGNEQAATIL